MNRFKFAAFCALWMVVGLQVQASAQQAKSQPAQKKPRAKRVNKVFQPIEDVEGLPRVLLLGDSISIGYTLAVREMLKDVANVHRANENCGPTTNGVQKLEKWLGEKEWDIIHFNFGLHDLKYVKPGTAQLVDVKTDGAVQQVLPESYKANLQQLVTRLKKTRAKLIWCATTPVPKGAKGRFPKDAPAYNAVAKEVMEKNAVDINDLFSFALARLPDIQQPANVHFSPKGSKVLAEEVARVIKAHLGSSD